MNDVLTLGRLFFLAECPLLSTRSGQLNTRTVYFRRQSHVKFNFSKHRTGGPIYPIGPTVGEVQKSVHGGRRRAHTTEGRDRKSTRLNSSHGYISYAVFCLIKKRTTDIALAATHHTDDYDSLRHHSTHQ